MATMNWWTIGSDTSCDVVVSSPTVSGRHCRLKRDGRKYFIEDLESTNGTFINGKRIEGCVKVAARDRVTLGQNTPMPWPSDPNPVATVRTIGRTPGNDLVLPFPAISARHALLVIREGRTTLEDLGSANGTMIGDPPQRITKAELASTDVVFFGSIVVPASQLLAALEFAPQAQLGRPVTGTRKKRVSTDAIPEPRFGLGIWLGVAALLAATMILAVAACSSRWMQG